MKILKVYILNYSVKMRTKIYAVEKTGIQSDIMVGYISEGLMLLLQS